MRHVVRYTLLISILVLSSAVLHSCAGPPALRAPEAPTGPHLTVLTYNVNWGMPARRKTLALIQKADADIVCLQETTPGWEVFLRARLKDMYPHIRFRHYRGAGGQAVLSKHPFEERHYFIPEGGWFHGWVNEVQTSLGPLQVMSLHLHPALNEQGEFSVRAYLATKKTRLKEIQTLYPVLGNTVPTLVLGDFNEGDTGAAVEWLCSKKGFTNALSEFDRDSYTWRWRTKLITFQKRFDHILYSKELRCLSAKVVQEGGSDHFPIRAVFEKRAIAR